MNLFAIFLTGLTSGGVSCAAVQGGLLAGVIANQEKAAAEKNKSKNKLAQISKKDLLPVGGFLLAKLFSHILLGFFLGFLGESISLSTELTIVMQVVAALFMLATAANFLELHPVFRHLSFQSPKLFRHLIKNTSQSNLVFAPIMLGLLSIFIPCGVTQSMEVLAVSSGSPIQGALIMFFFVLGTFPIFAALGLLTSKLSQKWQNRFNKTAAALLITLALYSLNGVLVAVDSPISLNKVSQAIARNWQKNDSNSVEVTGDETIQRVTIDIQNNGYSPRSFKVKKGIPVELTLKSGNVYSCAQSFVMRSVGIDTLVGSNQTQVFRFTPKQAGSFTYSCSMGMYSGVMEVI